MSTRTSPLGVRAVGAFADNYIWLIEAPRDPKRLVAVDPGDAAPVRAELERSGSSLAAILLTHHHPDHIGGVAELTKLGGVRVVGPADARIPLAIETVGEGSHYEFSDLGLGFDILQVPGHTLSHIAFIGHGALFCGDTLFSAGCGRMFEGTPPQMHASLNRLRDLAPETLMYCGHEYTEANLRFALTVEPANAAALDYRERVCALRAAGRPSLPSRLSIERQVNPFLRCEVPAVREAAVAHAGHALERPEDVFGELRSWKDRFR